MDVYTVEELDEPFFGIQTLREFITSSEDIFHIQHHELDNMSNEHLTEHLAFLTKLWLN